MLMKTLAEFCRVIALVLLMFVPANATVTTQDDAAQHTFSQVEMVPLNALSLGDAALVAPKLLQELSVAAGQAARLTAGDHSVEVRLFPIDRPSDRVSLQKSVRDRLGVKPGKATVMLRLLQEEECSVPPIEMKIRIESHKGTPEEWPGIVLGAPHGDCDMFTGEIVETASAKYGVPAVCAYGGRITYLGRWIDVNRPLQSLPDEDQHGVLPYRDWTDEAWTVFSWFRDKVLEVGKRPGLAEGSVPLAFYLDFHGHDLTVKDKDGKSVYRSVFECQASGFSSVEVQALKREFDRCVRAEYGSEAPPSYWGNLPEDRQYEFAGCPASFYYSGLGARVYGTLASNVAQRAVHIESPDFVRIPVAHRPRTAKVLANFMQAVQDRILPASFARQSIEPPSEPSEVAQQWAVVPAGSFQMGAPQGEGWSVEWPRHWVALSAYEIATTEVTCAEYAKFLNESLGSGQAVLQGDKILGKSDNRLWCVLWPTGNLALLQCEDGRIHCRQGRKHHPVNYVTWYGAQAMARVNHANLPTEAQWERAAGWEAKTQRAYRTGLSLPEFGPTVQAALMNSGHPSEDSIAPSTCPVGYFSESKSPVGCYDMSGNVWEWTADWHTNYPESNDTVIDPIGPSAGTMKTIRGGGWNTESSTATPSFRLGVSPDQALPDIGFRLVR
jgi:formylglycine-generating enzyme required for sulfatase activity